MLRCDAELKVSQQQEIKVLEYLAITDEILYLKQAFIVLTQNYII